MPKSYYERTGKKPPLYLQKQGNKLAKANENCAGTRNDKGQYYKCVARKAREIFDGKTKK